MRKRVAVVCACAVASLFAADTDPYLETSGEQAVNTGYYPCAKTKVVVDWAYTQTTPVQQRIFGSDYDVSDRNLFFLASYINGGGYSWACQDYSGNWTPLNVPTTTDRRTLTIDGPGNEVVFTDNGTDVVQKITQTHTKRANTPMLLFAQPCDILGTTFANFGHVRFYSMQVYEEGTLRHDFRPRTCGGVGVVYDTVTKMVLGSATETPLVASENCESVAGPIVDGPTALGRYMPTVPADGLTLENVNYLEDAAYAGPFVPRGDTNTAVSGTVTLRGDNAFGGALSLWYLPKTVSPRIYTEVDWSKDYWGNTDKSVQVVYTLVSEGGRTTFVGGCEDYTAGQRGDVVLFDGNFTFGGNVTPNGNDGHLAFKNGASVVGSIGMKNSRGFNSIIHVEETASLVCNGDVFEGSVGGGNPFHLRIDGPFTVNGTLSPYNATSSIKGTGTVNARGFVAGAMGSDISVATLNIGTIGATCSGTKFGSGVIGCYDGDTVLSGSYNFGTPTLRASTSEGAAADITLKGEPKATGPITKTGAGALVIATDKAEGLAGGFNVTEGALVFDAVTTLSRPVTVAAGAALGARATGAATLTDVTLADGAALEIEARVDGVGRISLPAGAVQGALTVRIDGATPPPAQTVKTILAGANLSAADLASISLEVPGGVEGELSIVNGDLVLTVTKSPTAAAQTLTWAATASTAWDTATANWVDALGAAAVFAPYDKVVFGETAGTVEVAADGVTAGAVTVNGAQEYAFTGGKIGGSDSFTIDGGAVVGLSAPLDGQAIVIKNGVLKPTVTKSDLFGSPLVPITVLDGGTFDMNNRAATTDDRRMTHEKRFRIAGEGATNEEGVKQGAIVNHGPVSDTLGRIHTIELTGDAMVRGGTGRWDMRRYSDAANPGRPQVTGEGHTLTIGGEMVCLIDADVNLKGVVITNDATLSLEGSTTETLAEGMRIQDGYLQFWAHSNPFTAEIFADGPSTRLGNGNGTTTVAGGVHVAEGTTLNLSGGNLAATKYTGGIFGPGALNVGNEVHYFASDVEQETLSISGGYAVYGDMTAAGNEKKWPKTIEIGAPSFDGGLLCFAPSTNSVYSGYTIRRKDGKTGSFVPSRQNVGSSVPVTTVEDTTIEGDGIWITMGFSTNTSSYVGFKAGNAVLGKGFVADNLNGICLGLLGPTPADATLTLAEGSSITMKPDAEIMLGQWSGTTNNLHRIVIDGGTLDASQAKVPYVGYDTRIAEFLVKSGTAKLSGVSTRYHKQHNMTPITVDYTARNSGVGYEVFGMSGGVVELGGDFTTERIYPYLPQIWLGGGVLKSMDDWATDFYQYATFETWGDSRDETKKEFTLDTNGHTVNFRSALQGNADVRITGEGSFVADYNVQGGLSGHWTIESTANLKNAAAFAGGLTLADGASATIDIGARTNYTSLAVACNANGDASGNEFTWGSFYQAAGVFPSLFTKDIQKLLTLTTTPFYTAFRHEAEFYVPEADTYTFATTYDDRCDVVVDGTRVAYNAEWNKVGVGQIALDVGWHRINVTGMDDAGGAGPNPAAWKEKGMAAGWRKGASTSTEAADYQPINSRTLKMRPVSTVRWNHRYVNASVPDDWDTNDTYTFSMVTNSMQGIHDTVWTMNKGSLNSYTGWTYVEPEDAGTWELDGVYDDRIGLKIDGKTVFSNESWDSAKSGTAQIDAGWHKFKVTVADGSGGWSYSGVPDYGAALYVKRPTDAAKVPFDERSIQMTADPYGFIGGELNVGAGATLTNASDTPCEIIGTVNGTGVIKGKYALTGTWNLAMDDGLNLKAVTWTDGGVDLSKGRLHIALKKRPLKPKYDLGAATGVEGIEERITATLDGQPYEGGFTVVVENGKAMLKNLKPANTVIYLR